MSAFSPRAFEALAYERGGASATPISFRQSGVSACFRKSGVAAFLVRNGHSASLVQNGHPASLVQNGHPASLVQNGHPASFVQNGHPAGLTHTGTLSHRRADGVAAPRDVIVKRAADIVLATIGLLAMGIPMLLIACAIRLTSRGPALFRQPRIGLNGRSFVMLKFRTMRHAPQRQGYCLQATRHDPRVTRIGAWLRRTSLDELPQLLNVLAGTMSLVGPRPHAPGTCAGGRPFEAVTRRYADRHAAKPGMTGLAQVRGWRGETDTEEKLLRRIDSDLEYIATWSPASDLAILWRTVLTMSRMQNVY